VQPGQKAEVTLKIYPGKVFAAAVDRIAYITSSGQLEPSGKIESTSGSQIAEPYGVVLDIDDESLDPMRLAGGAKGSAAIYTDSMQATHVIRKVMIRMDAWTNYVVP
jgi:multidrug resistance efflux pump